MLNVEGCGRKSSWSGNLPGVSEELHVNFFGVVGVSNMIGSGYLPNTNLKV